MTTGALTELALPAAAGERTETFRGERDLEVFLVGAQSGHPPKQERLVMTALDALHEARPIELVVINFDASEKSGSFEREIDLSAYRAFPDKEVNRGVTQAIVDQGFLSAGKAFAIVSDPEARLEAIDDWYGWASQKDALNELNAEVGKIVLAAQVVGALTPADSPHGRALRDLLSLTRLDMTVGEWQVKREALDAIDPAVALSELQEALPAADAIAAAFVGYKAAAMRFYEAGLTRVETLVRGAVDSMSYGGGRTGAIVLALPWLDAAAAQLRSESVGYARVIPDGISMASMLDEAGESVGEMTDSEQRLADLFSGERVRGRIEALGAKETEARKHRSEQWVLAGQNLSLANDARADEAFERALALDPSAGAYSAAGAHAVDHGEAAKALRLFESALEIDPRNARTWEGLGLALDGLGNGDRARKALVKSVQLEPQTGRFWCQLGMHYHRHGDSDAACYAFDKGQELGDDNSANNFGIVCTSGKRYSTPKELRTSLGRLLRR